MGSSRSHVGKGRSQMGRILSQNRLPTELKPNLTRNKNLFKGYRKFFCQDYELLFSETTSQRDHKTMSVFRRKSKDKGRKDFYLTTDECSECQ